MSQVEPVKEEPSFVHDLIEANYEAKVVNSTLPVVLDFYSADSEPCKTLAPRLGAVAQKFDGKILFLRTLRQGNEALAKTLNVTASPTLVFFKGGKEVGSRLAGVDIKRTEIKASVEALLK